MIVSLWDIAVALLGTAIVAAPLPVVPLPQSSDFFAETSTHLALANFSTDPTISGRVLADQAGPAKLEAFIFNNVECPSLDTILTYRLYIANVGQTTARDLVIQFHYPPGSQLISTSIPPQNHDEENRVLTWSTEGLAPFDGYTQFSVVVQSVNRTQSASLSVDYEDGLGTRGRTSTTHTSPGQCSSPGNTTQPAPESKLPAIICDPAETNCTPFLPNLGIRFGKATPPQEASTLSELTAEQKIPNIIPGECRVVADEVITEPAYVSALTRKYEPAAFYMEPLYRSGQEFETMIAQNTFLGFNFIKQIRPTLLDVHKKWWGEHARLAAQVLQEEISADEAKQKSEALLPDWQREVRALQQGFRTSYVQLQNNRRIKLPPVLARSLEHAKDSMRRACNEASDGGLEALLPNIKTAYDGALTERTSSFDTTQDNHRSLTPFLQAWNSQFYPALEEYKKGNSKPLEVYVGQEGAFFDRAFASSFNTYYVHLEDDKEAFERIRITSFETALYNPKRAATTCEKEKVFETRVEQTFCESSAFSSASLGEHGQQGRANNPDAVPYAPPPAQVSIINEELVTGTACSGASGDPWWSEGCECQCNENLAAGQVNADGSPVIIPCQERFKITRHDIAVTSQAECLATFNKHLNPFINEDQ